MISLIAEYPNKGPYVFMLITSAVSPDLTTGVA